MLLFISCTTLISQEFVLYELPYCGNESEILTHIGWAARYSEEHELAEWVAYQLSDSEVEAEGIRIGKFREDTKVPTGSSHPDDYKDVGRKFHKGHLAPAADMEWSEEAMGDSFFMTNITPQRPGFNTGVWKRLENRVRKWTHANDEVYVVAGPILTDEIDEWIGKCEW